MLEIRRTNLTSLYLNYFLNLQSIRTAQISMLKVVNNFNLARKLTILLSLIFLGGLVISGSAVAMILNSNAQNQITSEARVLLQTIVSIRDYTTSQISPELNKYQNDQFSPQTVPAYSAREVFEIFRTDKSGQEYFYKEATLNPRNLRDKADNFEKDVVNRFRQETTNKELRGFRSLPSGKLYYIARPLAVESSCLQCHSTPNVAPKSMIELYGNSNGFGWELNEIVAAQMIYIPASKVFQTARQSFVTVMSIVVVVFAVAIFVVNLWLNKYVVRPLKRMSLTAEAVSTGRMDAEFEQKYKDEIGRLAKAFTLMKRSLSICSNRLKDCRINIRGKTSD